MGILHISKLLSIFSIYFILIILPLPASAVFNANFDAWTINNGAIDASCPVGAVCRDSARDNGFLQREILIGNERYFQIILTEPGVSGNAASVPFSADRGNITFANENFVGAGFEWFKSKMAMDSSQYITPTIEQRFNYTSLYNSGAARDAANPWITHYFSMSEIDYGSGQPLERYKNDIEIFDYAKNIIDQSVMLGNQDVQKFYQVNTRATSEHSPTPTAPLLPGGTNDGDIWWGVNTPIQATWVGQTLASEGVGNAVFGFTKYASTYVSGWELVTDVTQLLNLTDPNPAGTWPVDFGAKPADIHSIPLITPTASILPPASPAGLIMPVAPESASSTFGPPAPFDSYTVEAGIITSSCPVAATCSLVAAGKGMQQREVVIAGKKYYQTIITDENASGDPVHNNERPELDGRGVYFAAATLPEGALDFASESFVRADGAASGIALRQLLAETRGGYYGYTYDSAGSIVTDANGNPIMQLVPGEILLSNVNVNSGWALTNPADPRYSAVELILDNAARDYNPAIIDGLMNVHLAKMEFAQDDSRSITIDQMSTHQMSPDGLQTSFKTQQLSGRYQTTARALTDPNLLPTSPSIAGNYGDPMSPQFILVHEGATNNGTIAWAPGDAIQVTWVGTSQFFGGKITTTSYANLSTGETTAHSLFLDWDAPTAAIVPDSWVAPFTSAPSLESMVCYNSDNNTYSLCGY